MPKKLATGKRKSRVRGRSTPKRELLALGPIATSEAASGGSATMMNSIKKAAGRLTRGKPDTTKAGDTAGRSVTRLKGKAAGKKAGRQARRLG